MTIRSVEAIPLCLPFEMGGPKPLFAGIPRQMEMLLVRVETDAGLVGWGEAFGLAVWPATCAALRRLIAPLAVGRDETDIPALVGDIARKLHLLGRTGAVMYALSGLDIALWDLAGKAAGVPLSQLLGGRQHDSLPAYASLMRYGDSSLVARNAQAACARGFQAIKLHEVEVAHVQAARAAIGPGVGLMLDTNCPWSVEQSLAMAAQLRPYDLLWLEEPVWPPEDFEGLAAVRRGAGMPVAAGENTMTAHHFGQMLAAGAVDFVQPSVTKVGGVSEFMKVAELAQRHAAAVMPHSPYFGPGLLATLHMAATFEDETLIEYSYADLGASPLGAAVEVRAGRLQVPTGAGLGQDPDPQVIEAFRVDFPA